MLHYISETRKKKQRISLVALLYFSPFVLLTFVPHFFIFWAIGNHDKPQGTNSAKGSIGKLHIRLSGHWSSHVC